MFLRHKKYYSDMDFLDVSNNLIEVEGVSTPEECLFKYLEIHHEYDQEGLDFVKKQLETGQWHGGRWRMSGTGADNHFIFETDVGEEHFIVYKD